MVSILSGHHGHTKDTDGPRRSSQGPSAVAEIVTEPRGAGTARVACRPSIKDAWDGRHKHRSHGQVLSVSL